MVCDRCGRLHTLVVSPGQMNDAKGAAGLLGDQAPAKVLLADKVYDANWFRKALKDGGITAVFMRACKTSHPHTPTLGVAKPF